MRPTKSLHLFGVNFRTASIATRESVSCDGDRARVVLRAVMASGAGEAVVLSTCNRTELYLALANGDPQPTEWFAASEWCRRLGLLIQSGAGYHLRDHAAARHLCRVACGLDSAVLGDVQILGQIKSAFATASRAGSLGDVLHQVFVRALTAGRQARTTTAIGEGNASVGAALVSMIAGRNIATDGAELRIAVVGAGKVAGQICRQLAKRQLGSITVINRTAASAHKLARECGGRPRAWDDLEQVMGEADVVLTAVNCETPVLRRHAIERAVAGRGTRMLVVDAGVPRNVEMTPEVDILNVDSILERQEHELANRRASVPAVERVIDDEVAAWDRWREVQPMETAIKDLFAQVARVSKHEARRLAVLHGVTRAQAETELVRAFKRHLHPYVRALRAQRS